MLSGILVLLLWMLQGVQAQVIIRPPVDIAVFVNQSAVFECETSGGGLQEWRVNGTLYQYLLSDVREDMRTSRVHNTNKLTIVARTKYNGTTVQCLIIVIGEGIIVESDIATLEIQAVQGETTTEASTVPPENVTTTPSHVTTGVTPTSALTVSPTNETTSSPMTTDETTAMPPDSQKERSWTTIIVAVVVSVTFLIVLLVLLGIIYRKCKLGRDEMRQPEATTVPLSLTVSTKSVLDEEQNEQEHEDDFTSTPTKSNGNGNDSRIVVKYTQSPPLPRINVTRSPHDQAAMSSSQEVDSDMVSFKGCTPCGGVGDKACAIDIDGDDNVASFDVSKEETYMYDPEGSVTSSSASEEESEDDGGVIILRGNAHRVENVLKQSDGVFTNPPLSHSYNIDVKSHGMADGPVDTEMRVRVVSDQEHEPVLVTGNNLGEDKRVDKKVECGQKSSTDTALPAANSDSGEVAYSSADKHASGCCKDVHSGAAGEGIPPDETDTGLVQPSPTTKPLKMKPPLGYAHHLPPVGKGDGLQLASPPQQQRERLRHKKKKKKTRNKPKPAIPQDMGPSAVEAPDPVEEERERFSLSSSPDAVD